MTTLLLTLCVLQSPLETKIGELLPKLAGESLEERTTAAAALKDLARSDPRASRPILRQRLQEATDDQVRAGLRGAIDALPKVELRLAVKGPVRRGEETAVQAWVRNVTEGEIVVPLPVIVSEAGFRFPNLAARIVDPKGGETGGFMDCWRGVIPPPAPEDFVKLAPGAEVDLLASPRVLMAPLKKWKPAAAGTWKVRVSLDWTAGDPNRWIAPEITSGSMDAGVPDLIARIPREKLDAELEVPVEEK